MFEKEAEEYASNVFNPVQEKFFITRGLVQGHIAVGFKDGAEFGYNKANEWHDLRKNPNDLPTDNSSLYYVLVYSWDFGLSHLYSKYGTYIPTVCEWDGEHFKALDRGAYTNARNIRNCFAWKEIVLPKEIKEND